MSKTIAYTVNDPDFFWSHRLSLAKSAIDKGFVVYLISKKNLILAGSDK